MSEPDFTHRYAEHGAGHPLPVTINPNLSAPAGPSIPTDRLVVDGVQLAVSDRLVKLAAIRDTHRAAGRAANDRMHDHREMVEDCQRRVRLIIERVGRDLPPSAASEVAQIEVDQKQWEQARATAQVDAEVASASWRDAETVLRAAIAFARENGAVIPATLQGEGK